MGVSDIAAALAARCGDGGGGGGGADGLVVEGWTNGWSLING